MSTRARTIPLEKLMKHSQHTAPMESVTNSDINASLSTPNPRYRGAEMWDFLTTCSMFVHILCRK